jgi:hypothetical protein
LSDADSRSGDNSDSDHDSDSSVALNVWATYNGKHNFQLSELRHNHVVMMAGDGRKPWLALVSDKRVGVGLNAYVWAKYMRPKVATQSVGEWKSVTGNLANFKFVKANPKAGAKGCANDVLCTSIIATVQWCVRGALQDLWCKGATITTKEWSCLLKHCDDNAL